MELSVSEVFLLSVLFAIPQILIFLVTYGVYYFVAIKKGIPKLKPLHVVDIAMPVVAACIWAFFKLSRVTAKVLATLLKYCTWVLCGGCCSFIDAGVLLFPVLFA